MTRPDNHDTRRLDNYDAAYGDEEDYNGGYIEDGYNEREPQESSENNKEFVTRVLSNLHTLPKLESEALERKNHLKDLLSKDTDNAILAGRIYDDYDHIPTPNDKKRLSDNIVEKLNEKDQLKKNNENSLNAEVNSLRTDLENQKRTVKIVSVLAGVLGLLVIICGIGWYNASDSDNSSSNITTEQQSNNPEVAKLQSDLNSANEKIKKLETDNDQAKKDLAVAKDRSGGDSNKKLADRDAKISSLEKSITEKDKTISTLRDQNNSKQDRINELQSQVNKPKTTVTKTATVTKSPEATSNSDGN